MGEYLLQRISLFDLSHQLTACPNQVVQIPSFASPTSYSLKLHFTVLTGLTSTSKGVLRTNGPFRIARAEVRNENPEDHGFTKAEPLRCGADSVDIVDKILPASVTAR